MDEKKALDLVEHIRQQKMSEVELRKSRITAWREAENNIEEEKEIEAIRGDAAIISPSDGILQPSLPVSLPAPIPDVTNSTGQMVLPSQPSSVMAVLTPIQSVLVEEPKRQQQASSINLAEFEGYSTTPFEEMELRTLNDKEELALLLQPNAVQPPASTYSIQSTYPQSYHSNWTSSAMVTNTSYTDPTLHYTLSSNWPASVSPLTNPMLEENMSKLTFRSSTSGSSIGPPPQPVGILRQAKSVPDLSEMSAGHHNSAVDVGSTQAAASNDKRLSSRTPPPRLSSYGGLPKPIAEEDRFNSAEKRLVQQLSDMGFPRQRAVKAVQRLGANEKKVVDQLLAIEKFCDLGHSTQHVEMALAALNADDWNALLAKHLELFDQLLAFGFPEERIGSALVAAGHDRDKALDILLMM